MAAGPRCERAAAVSLGPQLDETGVRLLEVVADDLLELLVTTVEPVGEALVEIRALRFRDTVVGGVTDEHVAEAKRVLDRLVRADQLLAHESREPCARRATPVGSSSPSASHSKSSPMIDARSTISRSSSGSRVEPGGEQVPESSRAPHPAHPRSATIASSCSTNSGFPSATSRMRVRVAPSSMRAAEQALDQLVGLVVGQRLERDRVARPGHAGRSSSSSGRARQRSRSGASRVQSASARSGRAASARPSGCPRTTSTSGAARARVLERLAYRPEDSPPALPRRRAAVQARPRHLGLTEDLDERPVGDALAVGKASADEHARLARERRRQLRASRVLPIPGGPNTVTSWQRRSDTPASKAVAERGRAPRAGRRAGRRACRRRPARLRGRERRR